MRSQKTKYAVSGAFAGAVNGFFGAGGGMVLIPLLTRWAKLEDKKAFATSVSIILPLSIVSAVVYILRAGLTSAAELLPYMLGGLIGGYAGGRVFGKVPTGLLKKLLALFIIYGGLRGIL